jgi:hypothetical protein
LAVGSGFLALGLSINGAPIWLVSLIFMICIAVWIAIFWQNQKIMRPLAFSSIDIFDDSLHVHELKSTKIIFFKDIQEIQTKIFPLAGGWISLKLKDGSQFRITTSLERSEYIAENLNKFSPKLLSEESAKEYSQTAIWVDHKWARIQESLQNWKKQIILNILVPFICTGILYLGFSNKGIVLERINIVLFLLGIFFVNIFIIWIIQVGKDSHFKSLYKEQLLQGKEFRRRNMPLEARVYKIGIAIHALIWMFLLLPVFFV